MAQRTALKRHLEETGRRQRWLAERVGIHESQLSRIVNGMHCDEATQAAIARELGTTVDELFPKAAA